MTLNPNRYSDDENGDGLQTLRVFLRLFVSPRLIHSFSRSRLGLIPVAGGESHPRGVDSPLKPLPQAEKQTRRDKLRRDPATD